MILTSNDHDRCTKQLIATLELGPSPTHGDVFTAARRQGEHPDYCRFLADEFIRLQGQPPALTMH